MATFNLNLQRDITPKTSLTIPGDGKVIVEITGDIDVPEPLLAQQIWDAAKEVVDSGKKTLKKKFKAGEAAGWTEAQISACIAETM